MDNNRGLVRFLGYTVLLCCAALAVCASLLAFTFATGDLPFGLVPLMRNQETKSRVLVEQENTDEHRRRQRRGELFARRLYSALEAKTEAVSAREEEVKRERAALEEYEKTVQELDAKLRKREQRIRKFLDYADEAERANVARLAKIVSASEPLVGAKILLDIPVTRAARILRLIDGEESAQLVNALTQLTAEDGMTTVTQILSSMQQLASGTPPPEHTEEQDIQ